MSRRIHKSGHVLAGMIFTLLAASPVIADDVEIYLGANLGVSDVPPNVLFIIDTSGSMDTLIKTQTTYDPATSYSDCFDPNRVYFTTSTSCWSSNLKKYVDLSAVKCKDALGKFSASGYSVDNFAQWSSNNWQGLSTTNHTSDVECRADNGIHGDGGSETWAADGGNGPWSNDSADSIDWGNEGSYTLSTGNYMNWKRSYQTVYKTRLKVVQETVSEVVNSMNNVNIGLMRFDNTAEGGMVVTPMGTIDTTRPAFLDELNKMYHDGGTPLAKALYEAAMYYQGNAVEYGLDSRATSVVSGSIVDEKYPSHKDSRTGNDYISPIKYQCQKNYAVLLTDGEPSSNDTLGSTQLSNIGASSCNKKYLNNSGKYMYHCLPQIAGAMAGDNHSTFADAQRVSTYTIGFATDQVLLRDTAAVSKSISGAGAYETAYDAAQLTTVFTNFLTDILGDSSTFSSPAVSVNAFNRTTHRSELYFSLFTPSNGPHWDGNFKRYQLSFNSDHEPVIKDVNGEDAVGSNGYFRDTAQSFWSADIDGKNAAEGGAASKLTTTRKVYTYTGSSNDLSSSSNLLHETNAAITTALLNVSTSAERDNLLKWARGIDVDDDDGDGDNTDARQIMGDPLHSEPAMIQYGGSASDPDITAYVATNDGYLHAINTQVNAGTELFSFVPRELLQNLDVYYQNSNSVTKTYGIDGSITAWVNDVNKDGVISTGTDHAYIYFGMRRGGNNYYAMDVSDRNSPKLMWTIKGGSGDFAELGQTWSRPVLRKIRLGGQDKYVLVFGGGYDVNQDGASVRTVDSVGRAIYIVDAKTGQRLWWSSVSGSDSNQPDMKYSIPSDVSLVDSNGDGYMNLMYVGDMGGQIWRYDIAKSESAASLSTLITGGRIADLAGGGSSNARRFYYPPEVAIIDYKGSHYLSLIAASGYRAHPLSTDIQDRIYMIRDMPISVAPSVYTTLTETDLFDTTDNIIGEGSDADKATARAALSSAHGWYIDMEYSGEKGLAKPVIFAGRAFITTYLPTDTTAGASCAPSEGTGRVYIVDVADGRPTYTNDPTVDKDDLTKDDRFKKLSKAGIPADPKFIKTDDANQTDWAVCIGTECFKMPDTNIVRELYWFER